MRTKILVILLAAIVGVALAAVTAATQQPNQPPVEISEVADGLHIVTGPGGNVGVRVTSEGVVVIDDKFEDNYDDIVASIASVTDQPIRYVSIRTIMGIHTGSNVQFAALAPILAHENVRTNILRNDQPGAPSMSIQTRRPSTWAMRLSKPSIWAADTPMVTPSSISRT